MLKTLEKYPVLSECHSICIRACQQATKGYIALTVHQQFTVTCTNIGFEDYPLVYRCVAECAELPCCEIA